MIPAFSKDYWLLSRENRGYYAWAQRELHRLNRFARRRYRHGPCCECEGDARSLVSEIFETGLGLHPMLDLAFAAVARAEIRFSMRFVPQRSHEERLTGSLVSEIEAAINLVSDAFRQQAVRKYQEERTIDFLCYDLSQGNRIEKHTGADLGVILHIDLPDFPPIIRFAAFQAKKLDKAADLDKAQFRTLRSAFPKASAYLFYDTDFQTLAPPLVVDAEQLESACNKDESTRTFSVSSTTAFDGLPLSLWLFSRLAREEVGRSATDFTSAMRCFTGRDNMSEFTGGRLAVLSVGKSLRLTRDIEVGLKVDVS
jgi:hypothetical protein